MASTAAQLDRVVADLCDSAGRSGTWKFRMRDVRARAALRPAARPLPSAGAPPRPGRALVDDAASHVLGAVINAVWSSGAVSSGVEDPSPWGDVSALRDLLYGDWFAKTPAMEARALFDAEQVCNTLYFLRSGSV